MSENETPEPEVVQYAFVVVRLLDGTLEVRRLSEMIDPIRLARDVTLEDISEAGRTAARNAENLMLAESVSNHYAPPPVNAIADRVAAAMARRGLIENA